jgi:hypothetical protein
MDRKYCAAMFKRLLGCRSESTRCLPDFLVANLLAAPHRLCPGKLLKSTMLVRSVQAEMHLGRSDAPRILQVPGL